MIVSVLLGEYLTRNIRCRSLLHGCPRWFRCWPRSSSSFEEYSSAFRDVDAKYFIVFGIMLLHIVAGVILNQMSPGVLFSGIRIYLKSLPFFFLPLVVKFEDRDLKWQLLLIAAICLIQLPDRVGSTNGDRRPRGNYRRRDIRYAAHFLVHVGLSVLRCCRGNGALS